MIARRVAPDSLFLASPSLSSGIQGLILGCPEEKEKDKE
jgi:hypothetical protein